MNRSNIEYLSGEVREILGKSPSSALHWSFAATLSVMILLTVAGFTFKYSEIIQGDIAVTTIDPPVIIHAPQSGTLARIWVGEGDLVTKGMRLAMYESNADLDDVLQLEEDLAALNKFELNALRAFFPDKTLQVGELAVDYSNFISAYEYVPLSESTQIDVDAVSSIREHNRQLERSNQSIQDAISAYEAEVESLEKEFAVAHDLYARTVDESKSKALFENNRKISEKKAQISTASAEFEKNLEIIRSNNARIVEMRVNKQSGMEERIFQLKQSIISLKNSLSRWKEDFLIQSPTDGKVSFYADLVPRQRVTKDEPLFAIVSTNQQNIYIGQVKLPIEGSGKVKVGQEVNIKFPRYPFREFGMVKGKVTKIYQLPKGDAYSVEVTLEDGLKTTSGNTLGFHQQMTGKAEIITDKQLFIERLFEKVFG